MMAKVFLFTCLIMSMAECGLAQGQNYGMTYGDVGIDASYLQQLSPAFGPKQGGTPITLQGAGFVNDQRARCRFSRLDPNAETTITKLTTAKYVSPTEVNCDAPDWEESSCPTCVPGTTALTGTFFGHTGSRYLRSSSTTLSAEVGVGDYIQLAAATIGVGAASRKLTQYYQIQAISTCSGEGCFCAGTSWAEDIYTVDAAQVTYNGTGLPTATPKSGFEIVRPVRKDANGLIVATDVNSDLNAICNGVNNCRCALYTYDSLNGGAGNPWAPNQGSSPPGALCKPYCASWLSGTKITLAEPVYKIPGRANVAFSGAVGYRATKFACTECKCHDGCAVTVSHTNDGKTWSGSGLGGSVWTGSALSFSLKDEVPIVEYIDLGLPGYRDSTRIMGPASGGTTISVIGRNFQNSPLLRCWFDQVQTMVKAQWISPTLILCKTPAFISRQNNPGLTMTNTQQDGAAMNPTTKVMVTNDGTLGDIASEGEAYGHLSQNPYLMDDGSPAFIQSFDNENTYTSGLSSNPFRSTCQEGIYPNEGMKPCRGSHKGSATNPDTAGNAVTFKYATCYDANAATAVPSLNFYVGANVADKTITAVQSVGQTIQMADMNYRDASGILNTVGNNNEKFPLGSETLNPDNVAGPLSYIQLHLEKPSNAVTTLEVTISANKYQDMGGTVLVTKNIILSKNLPVADYYYNVYFDSPVYLLTGVQYFLQVRWISGAQDVVWKYVPTVTAAGATQTGATFAPGGRSPSAVTYTASLTPVSYTFKVKGFACDGCRTKYSYDPLSPATTYKFGSIVDPLGGVVPGTTTYQANYNNNALFDQAHRDSDSFRSMLAQEFRPTATGTITHIYMKLKTNSMATINGDSTPGVSADDRAYVSIWITQYGKYGDYVCSAYGGLNFYNGCDTDFDGVFNQACALGSLCNPNSGLNGGCGSSGACTLATTVTNAHILRPESGGIQGPCGNDARCAATMSLAPSHQKVLVGKDGWIEFEFETPVAMTKHTTYFVNAAVIGNTDVSKEVTWYSGTACSDGVACAGQTAPAGASVQIPSSELRAAYRRSTTSWTWSKIPNTVFATKFTRCVSSTAQVMGFSTTGERTGCCTARASPQGGEKGAVVTITGRNLFPSESLSCLFRNEDGTGGYRVPAKATDYSFTSATCQAPTFNPHAARDCRTPGLCQGVELVMTNDGLSVGPQFMGPKWTNIFGPSSTPLSSSAVPAFLGRNPLKFLFSEIYVSLTGSDIVGDGTLARPYQTIQRGLDAANRYDQIVLLPGTYTGLGNRGLRHYGKKIQMRSYASGRALDDGGGTDLNLIGTVIDCQNQPDGFILNNNKDSDSPYAGYVDTQDIITRNCESLRIYDL